MDNTREYLLDNTKFFAIFLVVFGHTIEPLINNEIIKFIYLAIYSIHMPIFILISGMFSSSKWTSSSILKTIKTTLIPFLAFTFIYELFSFVLFKQISSYSLNFEPYWILWFLFSLFCWKLILPLFLQSRFPLTFAIAFSLAIGSVEEVGYFLGLSRTIYFFPMFILGYQIKNSDYWQKLLNLPLSFCFAAISIAFVILIVNKELPHELLFGSYSYARLEMNNYMGAIIRSSLYIYSIVFSIAVIMILPRRKLWLSSLGENTLYVYVWHGFFIKFLIGIGFMTIISSYSSMLIVLLSLGVALLLSFALSHSLIAKLTNLLILRPTQSLITTAKKN